MARGRNSQAGPWTIGGTSAEADPLLDGAFVDNGSFTRLLDPEDPQWFLIGRTGSGKSAALQQMERVEPGKVTTLNPRELAFQHITNLQAVRMLLNAQVRLEPFFHTLWRHLIICQVLRHRHHNASDDTNRRWFERLREPFRKRPEHQYNLAYIDQLEQDFWSSAEDQVHRHVEGLVSRVDAGVQAGASVLPVGASVRGERTHSREDELQWKDRSRGSSTSRW